MARPKLLCIGPLPPVFHGQSEAFDVLVRSKQLNSLFDVSIVDLNFVNRPVSDKILLLALRYSLFRLRLPFRKPDAVYISFGRGRRSFQRDYLFLKALFNVGVPVVAHYHGGDMPILLDLIAGRGLSKVRRALEETLRQIRRMIVLSEKLSGDFRDLVLPDKIRVVHNCFRIPPGYVLRSVNDLVPKRRNEKIEILFLSNVNPEKGFFEVLESIAVLKSRGQNIHFRFVGNFIDDDENQSAALRKKTFELVDQYKIGDMVDIRGPLYGPDKWDAYCKADIFVLPTYYKSEALPITIMEAMAAGCAVVTTNYRGIPDLIDDGVDGVFVKQRSAADIADKIKALCRDPLALLSMRKAAQKRALKDFTEERYAASITDIIKEVID